MARRPARVRIVIADQGWILERMAREIESRLPDVDVDTAPNPRARLHYYMNYSAWRRRQSPLQAAYFTHIEERDEAAKQRFFQVARRMDVSVCMAKRYVNALEADGAGDVRLIVPGVDLDRFAPKLKVGVVGRNYHTGRKGSDLVEAVLDVPGIEWAFAGEGWPGPTTKIPDADLPAFYRSLDYLLVPAYYEGGPMPALEAIACGTPVISGDVGFMSELPHRSFPVGDKQALRALLTDLAEAKAKPAEAAAPYSWDAWGAGHAALFEGILAPERPALVPATPPGWKILLTIGEAEGKQRGGPSVRVRRTAQALRDMGHQVDLWSGGEAPPGPYDIVHAFNVWPADESLERLDRLARFGAPVFLSPIFMDHGEWEWSWPILLEICGLPGTHRRLTRVLKRRAHMPVPERRTANTFTTEFHGQVQCMVEAADHLVCLSAHEQESLAGIGADASRAHLVHNGIEVAAFESPDPRAFAEKHGLGRYVLCVGRIEHRKNQALLAHALRYSRLQLALVGECLVPEYEQIVRQLANRRTLFAGRIDAESPMLASAYAGAAAFVLPSWCEGAPISALEAAACGDAAGAIRSLRGVRVLSATWPSTATPPTQGPSARPSSAPSAGMTPTSASEGGSLVRDRFTIRATSRDLAAAYAKALQAGAASSPAAPIASPRPQ